MPKQVRVRLLHRAAARNTGVKKTTRRVRVPPLPLVDQRVLPGESAADKLKLDGVLVLPVFDPSRALECVQACINATHEYPEYVNHNTPRVLGGFCGYGAPSSYHHPIHRLHTEWAASAALPVLAAYEELYGEQRMCETGQGRFLMRPMGKGPSAEAPHRDISRMQVPDSDSVFGGWLNLNTFNQYFVCTPGDYLPTVPDKVVKKAGFDLDASLAGPQMRKVLIPPGHMVLFFESIAHCVLTGVVTTPEPLVRQHVVYRLTHQRTSYMENTQYLQPSVREWCPKFNTFIREQATPPLKSGQAPVMYSASDASCRLGHVIAWSEDTFQSQTLCTKVGGKGTQREDQPYRVVQRYMTSLAAYELPLFPAWEDYEVALRLPSTTMTVRNPNGEKKIIHFTI